MICDIKNASSASYIYFRYKKDHTLVLIYIQERFYVEIYLFILPFKLYCPYKEWDKYYIKYL